MKRNWLIILLLTLFVVINCKRTPSPENAPLPYKYFKVIERQGLNLREGSTTESKKILTLPFDATGEIIQVTKDAQTIQKRRGYWLQVRYKGKQGWLFSGFVLTGKTPEELTLTREKKEPGILTDDTEAPSTQTEHIVTRLTFPKHEIKLMSIAGTPIKNAGEQDLYCGAPPRQIRILNGFDRKQYTYKPKKNAEGLYNPELMSIEVLFDGAFILDEFNGECSCKTRNWSRIFLIGKNGVLSFDQDIFDTFPGCGDFSDTTFRRVKIEKDRRRIFILERESKCEPPLNPAEGETFSQYKLAPFGPPKFFKISLENDIAEKQELPINRLSPENKEIFKTLNVNPDAEEDSSAFHSK